MYKLFDDASLVNSDPLSTKFLLLMIETAVNKAIIQHERITKIKNELPMLIIKNINIAKKIKDMSRIKKYRITMFSDVHHYFICWGEVNRLYRYLNKIQPIFTLSKKHLSELQKHCDFRNHLEHIEERIERGITDLGNISDDIFSFDNETVDIGVNDLEKLKDIHRELINMAENEFPQPKFRP